MMHRSAWLRSLDCQSIRSSSSKSTLVSTTKYLQMPWPHKQALLLGGITCFELIEQSQRLLHQDPRFCHTCDVQIGAHLPLQALSLQFRRRIFLACCHKHHSYIASSKKHLVSRGRKSCTFQLASVQSDSSGNRLDMHCVFLRSRQYVARKLCKADLADQGLARVPNIAVNV